MTTPASPDETRPVTVETLQAENADLRFQLEEAEETIRAIQQGAVDAFVVKEVPGLRIYTLEGADRPYRLFVEQMQQGAATLHTDGTIVYCNRRLAELLKMRHDQLVGAPLRDFVAAADLAVYDNLLWQGQTRSGQGEARLRKGDGGLVPAYLTFNVLPNDCGAAIGVFITDLTTQKHHEELAAAQKALREADRRKTEFLAILAHELRNPLAPLRNAVNILRLTSGDATAVQSTSAMLERQVNQMVRLVDDLLDVSRISRNKIELRKQRIELASVVEQAIECVRPMCDSMGHELTVVLPPAPVCIDGDSVRLTQVFANLLDNACKYTNKGGHLGLSAEVSRAEYAAGREVVVRVHDSGIGIAGDQLSHIFDMFAQVDTSRERSHSGLGIGLTLVKILVEMHGGHVEAHSEGNGHGSEFVVRLPISDGAATPPATAPQSVQTLNRPANTYRILVADDSQDSAESLALLLGLLGHDTRVALGGSEAVELAATFRPDVVLLDIGMPKVNGYEACRRIRSQPWGKAMMLIAQTGWGQDEDKRRTAEAGFNGHLVKPVDYADLERLLATLLPAHNAR
jgi:PAS domain S-box-containing protein